MIQEYKFATPRQLPLRLQRTEFLLEPSVFGEFNFFFDFANSEGQRLFSKNVHFILQAHTNTETFPVCSELVPLVHQAALKKNITFQFHLFSLEDDS